MATILYFASLAEALEIKSEQLTLPQDCRCVSDLLELLRLRGEPFASTFDGSRRVLVAINQEMSAPEAEITEQDEIAFFPPVTGG